VSNEQLNLLVATYIGIGAVGLPLIILCSIRGALRVYAVVTGKRNGINRSIAWDWGQRDWFLLLCMLSSDLIGISIIFDWSQGARRWVFVIAMMLQMVVYTTTVALSQYLQWRSERYHSHADLEQRRAEALSLTERSQMEDSAHAEGRHVG
jgi:multisubunit Na+/H+ antiporter MnhF subunit